VSFSRPELSTVRAGVVTGSRIATGAAADTRRMAESIADLVSRAGPVDVAGVDIPIGLGVDRE
jgi:hypothetical protein